MTTRFYMGLVLMLTLLLAACEAVSTQKYSETLDESFAVADAPTLTVDSFSGAVTVRSGGDSTIRVVATKRAAREKDLGEITVEMNERDDGLNIKTDRPSRLRNVSVELEITAPRSTQVDLHTGSGAVAVRELDGEIWVDTGSGSVEIEDASAEVDANTGSGSIDVRNAAGHVRLDTGSGAVKIDGAMAGIDAHTGSGSINVHNAAGPIHLDTGSGGIDYHGTPEGTCRFNTGSGAIKLRLPADINVKVELDTRSGDIEVAWPIDGQVSKRRVSGTIGSGEDGELRAHTGSGDIDLISQ